MVHTSKSTVIRRYAPDSAKLEDAKPSTLQEIQAGDQLRARGDRNADGSEMTAEEIFAGAFPIVEGLIKSVDASAGTISVQDMFSKKAVQVKITADSQLHKIPAEMAQTIRHAAKGYIASGNAGRSSDFLSKPNAANRCECAGWRNRRQWSERRYGARRRDGRQSPRRALASTSSRLLDQTPASCAG